jgi:cysteine-rich repeat protein
VPTSSDGTEAAPNMCEPGELVECTTCPDEQVGHAGVQGGRVGVRAVRVSAVVVRRRRGQSDEMCDDGVNDGGYGSCADGLQSLPGPSCGDGVVNGPEACDDGNPKDGDGCNVDCVESGSEVWTRQLSGRGRRQRAGARGGGRWIGQRDRGRRGVRGRAERERVAAQVHAGRGGAVVARVGRAEQRRRHRVRGGGHGGGRLHRDGRAVRGGRGGGHLRRALGAGRGVDVEAVAQRRRAGSATAGSGSRSRPTARSR